MLNFNRSDRPMDPKEAAKPPLKPSPYGTSSTQPSTTVNPMTPRPPTPASPMPSAPSPAVAEPSSAASAAADMAGSKLIVGVNIRLKGVEISNCDVLVIEGQVEATVNSKVMEIAKPGTLTGTAMIDVAEIHGEFSGELTARTKLVVHGTGRVTGTIRYGKLVVAEGGTLTGDLRQIDAAAPEARPSQSHGASPDMRSLLHPQPQPAH